MKPEAALQEQVADYFALALPPEVFAFHPMNEGKRGWQAQRAFKRGGGAAGLPDWGILHDGRAYWIELKAPRVPGRRGGTLSEAQGRCHTRLMDAGCPVVIARSLDDVQRALANWRIPTRDAAVRRAA